MMSTARGSSSSGSTKQQRNVKGFVKRCRSFKEDIISRLARNRSTSGADGDLSGSSRNLSSRSGLASPSSWSSKSPTPGDDVEPLTLITHRLKEVNLTLHFVESLIQKNCVELLGGSSNVMLDLMGCLFNDIKKMPSSDSAQFQSIISQLKSVLSDFLTAVDALLLKEGYDDAQREMYFEKVHESIATSRDALSGLRNLLDTNASNPTTNLNISSPFPPMKTGGGVLSPDHQLLVKANNNQPYNHHHPPASATSSNSSQLLSSPTRYSETSSTRSSIGKNATPTPAQLTSSDHCQPSCISPPPPIAIVPVEEEKRPPIPPKGKHFSRRSFDSDWPDSTTPTTGGSAGPSSPRRSMQNHHSLRVTSSSSSSKREEPLNLVVAPVVSLDQWLEQSKSSCHPSSSDPSMRVSISNSSIGHASSSTVVVSSSSLHQQSYQISSSSAKTSSGGGDGLVTAAASHFQSQQPNPQSDSSLWVNSAVYMGRTSDSSSAGYQEHLKMPSSSAARNRTYSDSYQLEYERDPDMQHLHPHHLESSSSQLDRLVADYERRSVKSGTTHNSLSLSLGSSLDNLLLVDAQSQQSGLSPNSNTSGTGCTGAMHSLSGSSAGNHPSDATGRLMGTNFQDFEADEDVFVADVVDGCPPTRRYHTPQAQASLRLSKQTPVEDDSDGELPPELPEKMRINKHYTTIDHSGFHGLGEPGAFAHFKSQQQPHQYNPRCPSPYDNVDENDSILQCWPAPSTSTQQPFMTQSESRVTLVGASGHDSEERPPLPPKKKHSLIAAYVEFMHNFDLHSTRHHHLCNHYGLRNPNFQEGISSSDETNPAHPHPQGFHRHYLSERSATMFNPSTGELPGFTSTTSTSTATSAAAASVCRQSAPYGSATGGGVNRAALYSASYHHFTTFSNSSIPSEENSPTHQHFPLTSSSSTSHSLSDQTSGGENGTGSGNEAKPPLPPKKSRSLLKGLLGDMSKESSLENEKSPIIAPNGNGNGHTPSENGGYECLPSPTSPSPSTLPPSTSNKSLSKLAVKTPTSPVDSQPAPTPSPKEGENGQQQSSSSTEPPKKSRNGSSTKYPHCTLDEDSIDLFMTDATPLLVLNKNPTTKSSPPTNNSSSANNGTKNNANVNANSNSGEATTTPPQLEVKGAEPLVLLVYAASPEVIGAKFRETFLLTYRNFLRPTDVVTLVWKRFKHFENKTDRTSMLHARATLELFIDVVIGLTPMDLDEEMVGRVRNCIYHLVCSGEIQSALKGRKGIIHKYQVRQKILKPQPVPATLAVTTEAQSLLKWSATSIAQQMTLLDADLFRELEPAELLLWAREQVEDLCPALNNFTEHFNKVSYWTRTRVLMCSTSRERNRTMKKLIGVMRKLREYNNFNSLLAVLAALDSAPIRRLGFSRRLTEALKPHAALTDSSGSFRTYRQALADCHPPCIPYIGLVLQDLTFVHIGNPDFLTDGKVNWVKRLQQWVILEPIRRLHLCHYGFSRNDGLLAFLNNFDEYLNDDDLWQLSESIKPQNKSNN